VPTRKQLAGGLYRSQVAAHKPGVPAIEQQRDAEDRATWNDRPTTRMAAEPGV